MSNYARGEFSETRTRSPVGLGAAIAINGAVVGALLFATPAIREKIPTYIDAINIPLDPPPPESADPPPQKQQMRREVVTSATPPVRSEDAGFETPSFPPQPPLPPGNGEGARVIEVPPRAPVFVGPSIDARYRAALQPPYPPGKIRAEEEGVVVVRVRIGADGRVKEVQKVEAADDAFYRATAEQAMKRWRFVPATSDGQPVESWRTMTVRFELDT